jgi:hypothetical protein
VAVACAAAGTLLTGQTPANLSSGWVSDAWGCTVKAGMAFIDAGAGLCAWAERRGRAVARQNASNTCAFVSALVQTPAGITNVQISPRILCKISSWHLGLASSCKFQGKICPRSQDMWVPSQVCRHYSSETKLMSTLVKWPWFGFKFFQGVP